MDERIQKELSLLRTRYPDIEYKDEGRWVRIPSFPLPNGWNRTSTDTCFQIPVGYPATQPYGIYVPTGLLFNGNHPQNYQDPAPAQPPFPGSWAVFSWQPDTGEWRPTANLIAGSNLLNWTVGFAERFRQGL